MKIYTVYVKEADIKPENIILVREGFSWLAAMLQFFWAFYYKMWWQGLGLFAISIFLSVLEMKSYVASDFVKSIQFGVLLFTGYNFNDWYRRRLTQQGYVFYGITSGTNEDDASYKAITNMLRCNTFGSSQNIPSQV